MSTEAQKPLHLFYCYAPKDRAFRDELDNHLTPLRRRNLINSWSDLEILPGTKWQEKIISHLDAAHIILLLVSSDFMASDYCYSVEMKRALERYRTGTACVIPIILRPIDWHDAPFSSLQVLPTDAKPVSTWPDRDAAFYDITQGVRRVVAELRVLLEIQEWFDKGKELHQHAKYEEAIVAFDHVIRLQSDNANAYYRQRKEYSLFYLNSHKEAMRRKGYLFFNLRNYKEAIDAFDHVIRLQPDNADAYFKKGCSLSNLKNYKEAVDAFDHAIRLQPDNANTYFNKGHTLLKLQRYEDALSCYNQAISLDPKSSSYYRAKAEAHEALAHQAQELASSISTATIDIVLPS